MNHLKHRRVRILQSEHWCEMSIWSYLCTLNTPVTAYLTQFNYSHLMTAIWMQYTDIILSLYKCHVKPLHVFHNVDVFGSKFTKANLNLSSEAQMGWLIWIITSFPSRALWSLVMVARTVAACSPPITEIREFGHMYKNRGLWDKESRSVCLCLLCQNIHLNDRHTTKTKKEIPNDDNCSYALFMRAQAEKSST